MAITVAIIFFALTCLPSFVTALGNGMRASPSADDISPLSVFIGGTLISALILRR